MGTGIPHDRCWVLGCISQKIQQGSCGQGDSWWYDEWDKDRLGAATMGVYVSPGGGTVFTAASTDWAHGLAGPERDA